jgi:hypothetical protein
MKESLLVIGAVLTFSILAYSINQTIISNTEWVIALEARNSAIAQAQQLMDHVASMNFDESTTQGKSINSPSELTSTKSIGKETGETIKDDVDDFDNITLPGDSSRFKGYELSVDVSYVDSTKPTAGSLSPTFIKRVTVTVSNSRYLPQPISLSSLVAYY